MNRIKIFGASDADCGYCKGARAYLVDKKPDSCSKAYTVVAENLDAGVYESLVQRGWRRSGIALYKPDNWDSCCPALSIRLPVSHFKPTKSQRKILKRMETLLAGPKPVNPAMQSGVHRKKSKTASNLEQLARVRDVLAESGAMRVLQDTLVHCVQSVLKTRWPEFFLPGKVPDWKLSFLENIPGSDCTWKIRLVSTACPSVAGRSKGKVSRSVLSELVMASLAETMGKFPFYPLQRTNSKKDSNAVAVQQMELDVSSDKILLHIDMVAKDIASDNFMEVEKPTEEDRLGAWCQRAHCAKSQSLRPPYRLRVRSFPAHESALQPDVHRLYWKYQTSVHRDADPFNDDSSSAENDDIPSWALRAPAGWRERAEEMLRNEYTHLSASRQARLRRAYISFYDFLVENPFRENAVDADRTEGTWLGTLHQHYYLENDILIAVGVVDVLPSGLSSVYLYYDPTFSSELLPLGKYSILKEIEWTTHAKLSYYYLGYYIESCQKMRYKAEYGPSDLLCPSTYEWVDASQAIERLRQKSPIRNCCTLSSRPPGNITSHDLRSYVTHMKMDVGQSDPIHINMLTADGQSFVQPLLEEFMKETSPATALKCVIDFRP